jgi:hypothetical protein
MSDPNEFFEDIRNSIRSFIIKKINDEKAVESIKGDLERVKQDRQMSKHVKTLLNIHQSELNKYILAFENEISDKIVDFLFRLETFKVNGELPKQYHSFIKSSYLALASYGGRFRGRYLKLPKSWIPLGYLAGVLEDLVVIMRTAKQTGISPNHLISLDQLITGLRASYESDSNNEARFLFMTKLLTQSIENITVFLKNAIDSQGKARRISMFTENGTFYYYSIQGLLGGVKFDSRVVKELTPDNSPLYALHFTRKELVSKIWNSEETTGKRARDKPLVNGAICKFDRPIHALTNIEYADGYYRIVTTDKDIRDRMSHGIKENNVRPKYEAGLVIDLKRFVTNYPGNCQINEIGTLLVHIDIPHEYILGCVATDEELEHFWNN